MRGRGMKIRRIGRSVGVFGGREVFGTRYAL